MSTLVEIAEFVESVLRLDLETPIRGFDGTDIGPSNEQAQSLANRTLWLKKQIETLADTLKTLGDREYVASVNKKTGTITITYEDVGAAPEVHKHKPSDIETTQDAGFVSATEKSTWNDKQDRLVSGETLKTVLGLSLLGEGNIEILSRDITVSSDKTFVSDKEKDYWNAKQEKLVSGTSIITINGKSLLGEGDMTIGYGDVGADKSGAATTAVTGHVSEEDPHEQYLTKSRASESFLPVSAGNQPNGYLQLDEKGNVPAAIADLYKARYFIVDDLEERLAIPVGGDITISLQLDDNTTYYLDPEKDPSVESNWKKGQTTEVDKIISVFGRTGVILAQTGDYTADQITETDDRTFVSKDDRDSWNAKQQKLVSGTNLRTINGETILGASDIEITPDSIGAAQKDHKHSADDITTTDNRQFITSAERKSWNDKQDALVSGTDVKTVNNEDILGSGNISITPEGIGAAEAKHTHLPSDIKTDENNLFVTSTEKSTWSGKQDALKSGTTIKTINDESILGSGDIEITPETIGAAEEVHKHKPTDIETNSDYTFVTEAERKLWTEKQSKLVSGANISTVFGKSLLTGDGITLEDVDNLPEVIFNQLKEGNETSITLDSESGKVIIGRDPDAVKADTPVIVDIENATAGENYIFAVDKTSFVNNIKLFKQESILPDSDVTINYDNPVSPVTSHYPTGSDSTGHYPGSKNDITVTMSSTSTGTEKYISDSIAYDSVADYISIVPDTSLKTVIPGMENTSTMFTVISSTNYGYMYPKQVFYAPIAEGLKTTPDAYFGNKDKWWVRTSDVYIGISSKEAFTILGYGFQNFEEFYWEDCTEASLWQFQARNEDSDDWITLDTQSKISMKNYNGSGWTNFMFDKSYTYKQYRLLILDVFEKPKRPSVIRMALLNYPGVLVKSAAGDYYTVDELGTFTKITTPSSEVSFKNNCIGKPTVPTKVSDIKNLFPIKICSYDSVPVKIKQYKKVPAIAIQDPVIQRTAYDNLKRLVINNFYSSISKEEIRIALTPNNKDFYGYSNGWKLLGQYSLSDNSASDLVANGMTPDTLNAVTESQWDDFLKLTDARGLGIAYGRNIANVKAILTPKAATLTFNTIQGWKLVPLSKVSITFDDTKLIVSPTEAGTYKLSYLFR